MAQGTVNNVPFLREYWGTRDAMNQEELDKTRNVLQVVDAARRLAELQNMPMENRLRRAQIEKQEFELREARKASQHADTGAQRYMQPMNLGPIAGPTRPGEDLGEDIRPPGPAQMESYIRHLYQNPRTIPLARQLEQGLKGEWMNVPAGAISRNVVTGETVEGNPRLGSDEQKLETIRRLEAMGDFETADLVRQGMRRGDSKLKMTQDIGRLTEKFHNGGLTEPEKREFRRLYGILTSRKTFMTAGGPVTESAVDLPDERAVYRAISGGQLPPGEEGTGTVVQPGVEPPLPGSAGPAARTSPGGTGTKALDNTARERLSDRGKMTNLVNALHASFRPEFANYIVPGSGAVSDFLSRRGITGEMAQAAANWWQGLEKIAGDIRHNLYGATLTQNEKENFEKIITSRSDNPTIVMGLLNNMKREAESEARKYRESTVTHYLPKAVDEALGIGSNPYVFGLDAIKKAREELKGRRGGAQATSTAEFKESRQIVEGPGGRKSMLVRQYSDGRVEVSEDGKTWKAAR